MQKMVSKIKDEFQFVNCYCHVSYNLTKVETALNIKFIQENIPALITSNSKIKI